jgi:hypothetical protein
VTPGVTPGTCPASSAALASSCRHAATIAMPLSDVSRM